jgi:hypothetical protein
VAEFSPKYDQTVDYLVKDTEALLCLFGFPAAHCKAYTHEQPDRIELRDGAIASACHPGALATEPRRLTMAFKLLTMAQQRWRTLNGAHWLPLVRAGGHFVDGVYDERRDSEEEKGSRLTRSPPIHNF